MSFFSNHPSTKPNVAGNIVSPMESDSIRLRKEMITLNLYQNTTNEYNLDHPNAQSGDDRGRGDANTTHPYEMDVGNTCDVTARARMMTKNIWNHTRQWNHPDTSNNTGQFEVALSTPTRLTCFL